MGGGSYENRKNRRLWFPHHHRLRWRELRHHVYRDHAGGYAPCGRLEKVPDGQCLSAPENSGACPYKMPLLWLWIRSSHVPHVQEAAGENPLRPDRWSRWDARKVCGLYDGRVRLTFAEGRGSKNAGAATLLCVMKWGSTFSPEGGGRSAAGSPTPSLCNSHILWFCQVFL